MELNGIKINFIGDSITEGHGASSPDKTYWAILGKETGATVRGYGISGTRFAKQTNPSIWPSHDLDFVMRAQEMDDDADVVVVFGGTNDFGHGDAPIGNPYDRDNTTFYGACHKLFTDLINKDPTSTIVIMTPLHRLNEDNPCGDAKPAPVGALIDYVNIIKEVAAYYSLPLLDLWSLAGIQPKVEINRAKYCPDGLHPNDDGHLIIKNRLVGFLKAL